MQIDSIKTKLDKLKQLDSKLKIFGASAHKYKTNAVLSESEVKAYEDKHGIRLPEEYREYLLQIGNGGAGPFYGLYKLGENEYGGEDVPDKPFSLTVDQQFPLDSVYEEIDKRLADLHIEDEDEEYEMHEKIFEELCKDVNCGFVTLGTEGCGMDSILIVNGPAYGTVWYFDFSNDAGIFVLTNPDTGKPMTFFEWFEIWLDTAIKTLETKTKFAFSGYISAESYSAFINNK